MRIIYEILENLGVNIGEDKILHESDEKFSKLSDEDKEEEDNIKE